MKKSLLELSFSTTRTQISFIYSIFCAESNLTYLANLERSSIRLRIATDTESMCTGSISMTGGVDVFVTSEIFLEKGCLIGDSSSFY